MKIKLTKKPKVLQVDERKYIADDGEEFFDRYECRQYETCMAVENLRQSKNVTVYDTKLHPDHICDESIWWFTIHNKDGLDEIISAFPGLNIWDGEDYCIGKVVYIYDDMVGQYYLEAYAAEDFIEEVKNFYEELQL